MGHHKNRNQWLRDLPIERRKQILQENDNDPVVSEALGIVPEHKLPRAGCPKNERMQGMLEAARRRVGDLPVRNETLRLWFPGVRLGSINRLLGSQKMVAQTTCKRECQQAVWTYRGHLHRFTTTVEIDVWQVYATEKRAYDADNLHKKPLVDAIVALGVLKGDAPAHVSYVGSGNLVVPGLTMGVYVVIQPSGHLRLLSEIRETASRTHHR